MGVVSISQSSLGGSRPADRGDRGRQRRVSISPIEFGRFTPPAPTRNMNDFISFNLAIEFGRFTPDRSRYTNVLELLFQSRNRVWAVPRRCCCRPPRPRPCFNLAIEFGPVHARCILRRCASRQCDHCFNLAIEFGRFTPFSYAGNVVWGFMAVSISQSSLGGSRCRPAFAAARSRSASFNLAIEFGRFTPESQSPGRPIP